MRFMHVHKRIKSKILEMSAKKELFVNTHGACFLCMEKMSSSASGTDNDEPHLGAELCLRTICRYLNINPCTVLLKSLRESMVLSETGGEKSVNGLPCDFAVMLCGKCSTVARKLSSAIRELEIAQMLVDHHLQSLNEILNVSEGEKEDQMKYWREYVINKTEGIGKASVNDAEMCLVENLRKEAKRNCSERMKVIKSTSPMVHLSRLNASRLLERPLTSTTPTPEPSSMYDEDNTNADDDGNMDNEYPPSTSSVVMITEAVEQPTKLVQVQDLICGKSKGWTVITPSQATSSTRHIASSCPFCDEVICTSQKMTEHQVMHHLDQLFSTDNKLPSLTREEFKTCCYYLIEKEMTACRVTSTVKSIPITHCSYCDASFRDIKVLHVHLGMRHLAELQPKLIKLQQRRLRMTTQFIPNVKNDFVYTTN